MLSNYQLKIVYPYNISIGNVKRLVSNFFDEEKYALYHENVQLLETTIKTKKNASHIRIQSITMVETICWIQHKRTIGADKKGQKDGKASYKSMNNAVYGKTMKNLRNRIDVKLVSNKKDYLKWTSKPSFMSQNVFDNYLVEICKSNVTLALNKPLE